MNTAFKTAVAGLLLAGAAVSASAATQVFAGAPDDPGNLALVGGSSGNGLGAPDFSSIDAIADNVALYDFDVTSAGQPRVDDLGGARAGRPWRCWPAGGLVLATRWRRTASR